MYHALTLSVVFTLWIMNIIFILYLYIDQFSSRTITNSEVTWSYIINRCNKQLHIYLNLIYRHSWTFLVNSSWPFFVYTGQKKLNFKFRFHISWEHTQKHILFSLFSPFLSIVLLNLNIFSFNCFYWVDTSISVYIYDTIVHVSC